MFEYNNTKNVFNMYLILVHIITMQIIESKTSIKNKQYFSISYSKNNTYRYSLYIVCETRLYTSYSTNLFCKSIGTGKKQKRNTMKHYIFLFMFIHVLYTLRFGSAASMKPILSSTFVSELLSYMYYL